MCLIFSLGLDMVWDVGFCLNCCENVNIVGGFIFMILVVGCCYGLGFFVWLY